MDNEKLEKPIEVIISEISLIGLINKNDRLLRKGMVEIVNGDYKKSLEYFNKIILNSLGTPKNSAFSSYIYFYGLSKVFYGLGQYEEALNHINKSIESQRENNKNEKLNDLLEFKEIINKKRK